MIVPKPQSDKLTNGMVHGPFEGCKVGADEIRFWEATDSEGEHVIRSDAATARYILGIEWLDSNGEVLARRKACRDLEVGIRWR